MAKKHLENQTGSDNSFRPVRIKKKMLIKNMKLGNKIYSILILFYFSFSLLIADEKITSTPLINIDKITPSFEETDEEKENISSKQNIKEKKIT